MQIFVHNFFVYVKKSNTSIAVKPETNSRKNAFFCIICVKNSFPNFFPSQNLHMSFFFRTFVAPNGKWYDRIV